MRLQRARRFENASRGRCPDDYGQSPSARSRKSRCSFSGALATRLDGSATFLRDESLLPSALVTRNGEIISQSGVGFPGRVVESHPTPSTRIAAEPISP